MYIRWVRVFKYWFFHSYWIFRNTIIKEVSFIQDRIALDYLQIFLGNMCNIGWVFSKDFSKVSIFTKSHKSSHLPFRNYKEDGNKLTTKKSIKEESLIQKLITINISIKIMQADLWWYNYIVVRRIYIKTEILS